MAGTTPRRTPQQKAELTAFIKALLRESPYGSQAAFAGAAGVGDAEFSNWIRGARSLDGYNLLKLIRASGVLREMLGPPTPGRVPQEYLQQMDALQQRLERLEALARERQGEGEGD